MTSAEDLLRELGETATNLGPAVMPVGVDELLHALTDTARELFGAAACSLALLSEDESELVYTTAAGAGAEDVTGMRMPSNKGVAGWVVNSGQPIAISDLGNDPRFARNVAEQTGYVPQAILAVPVVSSMRTLGVMSLLDRDARRPGADQDMRLLTLFAAQAAMALESVRSFSDLGRVLLAAVATAAGDDTDLSSAAQSVADQLGGSDRDLAALAGTFALLARRGPEEARLARGILTEVTSYVERRSTRTR